MDPIPATVSTLLNAIQSASQGQPVAAPAKLTANGIHIHPFLGA